MNGAEIPIAMLAGMYGGWKILLILAVVLLLFGAKHLPNIARGLGKNIGAAAGRPIGEALTTTNQTAEDQAPLPSGSELQNRAMRPLRELIVWIAQGFGIGRIPFAPGTWGSLLGLGWFSLLTLAGDFRLLLSGSII